MRSFLPRSFGRRSFIDIELQIALSSDTPDSPIVFLQTDDDKFIAIEMVNHKIRLAWNLDGTTQSITHPLEITFKNINQQEAWYHIEAQEILNTGSLNVRQMNEFGDDKSTPIYAANNIESSSFHLSKSSRIWVGGVPINETKAGSELITSGLQVVIHQLKIDRHLIGLWNAASFVGQCAGEISGPKETDRGDNVWHFSGVGYSNMTEKIISKPNPKTFEINLWFKTMDENALIFLAVDEANVSLKYFLKLNSLIKVSF